MQFILELFLTSHVVGLSVIQSYENEWTDESYISWMNFESILWLELYSTINDGETCKVLWRGFCSIAVFKCALHAQSLQFGPGQKQSCLFYLQEMKEQNSATEPERLFYDARFCGVVFITCASQAQTPQFEPGWKHTQNSRANRCSSRLFSIRDINICIYIMF